MKQFLIIGVLMIFMLSASLLFAEDQVQKANPPSRAEQNAHAQPAPAQELRPDPAGKTEDGRFL